MAPSPLKNQMTSLVVSHLPLNTQELMDILTRFLFFIREECEVILGCFFNIPMKIKKAGMVIKITYLMTVTCLT